MSKSYQERQARLLAHKQAKTSPIPQKEQPVIKAGVGYRFVELSSIPNQSRSPQVSIVIAGRNSEKFIAQTIESCLQQTVNCEIIYSDDCSTDSSVRIANTFINRGLRIIPHGIHSGVCATRNRGALLTRSDWIVFVDTDDILPPNYVEDMVSDIDPGVVFIYPNTKPFGSSNEEMMLAGVPPGTFWENLDWSKYDMWQQNQVSTTSMWNRQAFMAAGMWDETMKSMWDYGLAIECSKYGKAKAGRAVLNYRIHGDSVSSQLNERHRQEALPLQEETRRKYATLGIGSLTAARCPKLFPLWLDKLAQSVGYFNRTVGHNLGRKLKPQLLILLHNDQAQNHLPEWTTLVRQYSDTFHSVEFQFITTDPIPPLHDKIKACDWSDPTLNKLEEVRRISTSTLLASACQRIQDQLRTDLVWLLEDDIIVPVKCCEQLFLLATSGCVPAVGVSGRYYNRHSVTGAQLGGWIKDGKHVEPHVSFQPVDQVDFVGTGCLMYYPWRPFSPKLWRPLTKYNEPGATAHDWAWSEDVKKLGGHLLALGSVDCHHYINETEYV